MLNHLCFLILALWTILSGCASSKKSQSLETKTERSLPVLPESRINIPVKVAMKQLLDRMDAGTAKEFTSEKWPDYFQSSCDFRYKYRFVRSPFTFNCLNNTVNISFQGNYQIAGSKTVCAFDKQLSPWISGSCGFGNEPMRKVDINIISLLKMLPQHELKTTTSLNNLIPRDKCEVSLLKTDVTQEVMDSIRVSVETYCTSFDQFVNNINNINALDKWRKNRSPVMPVMKYGFMNLYPTYFRLGRFNYQNDTLYFSVGFYGNPKFSSDSMQVINPKPLPPVVSADQPGGIATYLHASYDYTFLSKLLNDSLKNKPFQVEGRTFLIRNINLAGTEDNKIQLDISFDGYKKGTLRLSGTPLLDSAKQLLSMPDIAFALDSKDMLVNISKGLFRKKIMTKLKDQSVLDVGALIEKNKALIAARLNQPINAWLNTKGDLQVLKIVGLLPQKNAIQLQVYFQGNLIIVGKPPAQLLPF